MINSDLNSDLLDNFSSIENPESLIMGKKAHFNASSIFYKGLFGFILCLFPAAIFGLILVKICLEQAKEARNSIRENPELYLDSTVNKINLGRKFALIGLALFILEIFILIILMSMH